MLFVCACGPEFVERDAPFIALDRDFAGFRSWESFDGAAGAHGGATHRTYLSERPPPGRTAFPVGTRMVKVVLAADGSELPGPHAMAKRGGDYNADAATGWEWFELGKTLSGNDVIAWRGQRPPREGEYQAGNGTGLGGDCNACHVPATNDAVLDPKLSLGTLGR